MVDLNRLTAVAAFAALAMGAAACTPAADTPADQAEKSDTTTHTIVETREVAAPPVVIEREVPTVVIENRDDRPSDRDSTTVRAGKDGIEVETTNR